MSISPLFLSFARGHLYHELEAKGPANCESTIPRFPSVSILHSSFIANARCGFQRKFSSSPERFLNSYSSSAVGSCLLSVIFLVIWTGEIGHRTFVSTETDAFFSSISYSHGSAQISPITGNRSPPTTDSASLGNISSHPPDQTSSNREPKLALAKGIRGLCQRTLVLVGR